MEEGVLHDEYFASREATAQAGFTAAGISGRGKYLKKNVTTLVCLPPLAAPVRICANRG